jgi:hypothetical protein
MDCHNDAGMRVWELGWHCAKIGTLSLSKCMPGMQGDCFAKCVPEMKGCKCEMSAKIGTLSLSKCVLEFGVNL